MLVRVVPVLASSGRLCHSLEAVFHAEVAERLLVEIDGQGSVLPVGGWMFDKFYQVVFPGKHEIPLVDSMDRIAVVQDKGARQLVAEHVLGYELLTFPAHGSIAGVGDLR